MKRLAFVVVVALATVALLAPSAPGATTVSVSGTEFRFTLSKRTVAPGSVTFRFRNRGRVQHDFKIAGRKTAVIGAGKSATLRATLRTRTYRYLCTVPGHAAAGMKGSLRVR